MIDVEIDLLEPLERAAGVSAAAVDDFGTDADLFLFCRIAFQMDPLNFDLKRRAVIVHLGRSLDNDRRPDHFEMNVIDGSLVDGKIDAVVTGANDAAAAECHIGHLLHDEERLLGDGYVEMVDDACHCFVRMRMRRTAVPPAIGPYRQMKVALQCHVNTHLAAIET